MFWKIFSRHSDFVSVASANKVGGLVQYQWSESGLSGGDASPFLGGNSPNDGYAAYVFLPFSLSSR